VFDPNDPSTFDTPRPRSWAVGPGLALGLIAALLIFWLVYLLAYQASRGMH